MAPEKSLLVDDGVTPREPLAAAPGLLRGEGAPLGMPLPPGSRVHLASLPDRDARRPQAT